MGFRQAHFRLVGIIPPSRNPACMKLRLGRPTSTLEENGRVKVRFPTIIGCSWLQPKYGRSDVIYHLGLIWSINPNGFKGLAGVANKTSPY